VRLIDRYVGIQVIAATLIVVFVLVSFFSVIVLVDEMGSVGTGRYTVLGAVQYMLLTLPSRTSTIFPVGALIGSLIALGGLSSNSELTVIRASGVSVNRLIASVMKGGAVLMVVALAVSELLAPYSERIAQERRSVALTANIALRTEHGFWLRDGLSFINVRRVLADDILADVYIYEFDKDYRLRVATHATRAVYTDDGWRLEQIQQSEISENRVVTRRISKAIWRSRIKPDQVSVVALKPESLSALGLYRQVRFLRRNGLDAARYELALWSKLIYPFSTGVMIFLAATLVLGRFRSIRIGQRILLGAIVGVTFHIINQAFMRVGLVYELSPMLSAVLPTAAFLLVAVWMQRRLQ